MNGLRVPVVLFTQRARSSCEENLRSLVELIGANMGITVTEVALQCDREDCSKGGYSYNTTKKMLEDDGWQVIEDGSQYIEDWTIYCPEHANKQVSAPIGVGSSGDKFY